MKKMTLVSMAVAGLVACLFSTSCNKKMHPNQMAAQAQAPKPAADPELVPFTKAKMQQLQNSNIDLRQVQFYVDQKLILRRMTGGDKAMVKGGTIVRENDHATSEMIIPAMTPVVCEGVSGDSLMISFQTPNQNIPFGALYGSNTYSVLGTNWINGSADVTYNDQTYRIICGTCGNVAEVKLLVREANIDKSTKPNTTVAGKKAGQIIHTE